ncbi:hypothetical protein Rsub_02365 [Raphidocelis subcapitata]|uniref:Amino acid transporter transmembrane domain-containing protein n=1 Tax=Raphidocelis subcapitata TaxID=307507 RepID=A0A2V0NXJ3_9CHLO|nr:hypothetical protein Rsub_02365 [Raphidocelis subcapitata]|eukprot:GBF89647.1 hypothetical protein Rsub_02365 [Raphidocelis subcapitata]
MEGGGGSPSRAAIEAASLLPTRRRLRAAASHPSLAKAQDDSAAARGERASGPGAAKPRCGVGDTLLALLSLQLGWGLWLMPHSWGQLGWLPGMGVTLSLAAGTAWSGSLYSRLYAATPGAVLLGDIAQRAAGPGARAASYCVVYALDATRCVILHLAAAQSLRHALGGAAAAPLPACGAAVLVAVLALSQVRSLSRLSWFFGLGTAAQLTAIAVVAYQMWAHPFPSPRRALVVRPDGWLAAGPGGVGLDDQLVAAFNIIFAFGGQFAFVELLSSMRQPSRFPEAVTACTGIMSLLYLALGAFGYLSCGADATEILVFSFREGPAARAAGAFVLLQALAQYLVNLNVFSHNLLVLLARRSSRGSGHARPHRAASDAADCDLEAPGPRPDCARGAHDSPGPLLAVQGPHSAGQQQQQQQQHKPPQGEDAALLAADGAAAAAAAVPSCSADHSPLPWFAATAFVVGYSFLISMTVPFFSALVGVVSSSTYLLCAYTLPCIFALRMLGSDLTPRERAACRAAVPATIALSALGLACSLGALGRRVCSDGRCAALLGAAAAAAGGGGGGSSGAGAAVSAVSVAVSSTGSSGARGLGSLPVFPPASM